MALYAKISNIVDQDRTIEPQQPAHIRGNNLTPFSFLEQKGPRTLNHLNKKTAMKGINLENQKIKAKLDNVKSNYSLKMMDNHQRK